MSELRRRAWWALLPHIGYYADRLTLRMRLAHRLWLLAGWRIDVYRPAIAPPARGSKPKELLCEPKPPTES